MEEDTRMPVRMESTEWEGDTLYITTMELIDGVPAETAREMVVEPF